MKVLDLTNKYKSEIQYVIHQFPDGEKHFEFLEDVHDIDIDIKCRIKSADDAFILCQICDILRETEKRIDIHVYYMMSMRMDRAMSKNRSFSLFVILSMMEPSLSALQYHNVYFYEPHSDFTCEILSDGYGTVNTEEVILPWLDKVIIPNDAIICFPDEGAKERYSSLFPDNQIIHGHKKRNEKGEITGYGITFRGDFVPTSSIYVVDDLCDGGGTFMKLADEFDKLLPGIHRTLCITHMIQEDAVYKLQNRYDQLIFTNSFEDWYTKFPNLKNKLNIIDIL